MDARIYVVDAFTSHRFGGNPVAVVLFETYPDDDILQAIAAENNLAETAFPICREDGHWDLRWFTPTVEVPLCGHATLASAFVLFNHILVDTTEINFETRQSGQLRIARAGDRMTMDFPAQQSTKADDDLSHLFGDSLIDLRKNGAFNMAVLCNESAVREFVPEREAILLLDRDGLIITARAEDGYHCVSRFFAPALGIDEDPVTGSAHTMLVPYWAEKLGQTDLRALQASSRGGELFCRLRGDRVEMSGNCVLYLSGSIQV
jgi:PhzF family phenazine biosynthesis protein